MLLSGLHSLHNGTISNDIRMLAGEGNYFGEVLRDAGYRTGYYGKWHLYGGDRVRGIPPGPFRYGFDHEFLTNNCTLLYDAEQAYFGGQDGRERNMYGDWEPYAQTRQALEFVDAHAAKPFALFLSWHPPRNWGAGHEGYAAPADLLALRDPAALTLRPTVEDSPAIRRAYQAHMAMISGLDRAFGWLLAKLEERGLAENTIVVFTSDLLLGTLDLMPTLLGLLGLPVPETCHGRDASAAVVAGRDDGVDAQPLFMLPMNWRGVYTRRYTYPKALQESEGESPAHREIFNALYDREQDPLETKNLFHDPAYADAKAALHATTHDFMERFGDPGIPYGELVKIALHEEDRAAARTPPAQRPRGWEARPIAPPVELLKTHRASQTRP